MINFVKCFLSFSFIFIMLNSCNNANQNQIQIDEHNLKQIVDKKNENISWTQELEKSRLSQRIDKLDYINSSLQLTPNTMVAFESSLSRLPVYPSLDNFGSLDISDIDENALYVVNQFCSKINDKESCQNLMNKNSIFALTLFLYDTSEINFNFSNYTWLIGQPFISENNLSIPVRFKNETNTLDIKLYLTEEIKPSDKNDSAPKDNEKKLQNTTNDKFKYKVLDIEIFDYK